MVPVDLASLVAVLVVLWELGNRRIHTTGITMACWTIVGPPPDQVLGLVRPTPSGPADHVCVLVQPVCTICTSLRSITADFHEVRNAMEIRVREARKRPTTLLFDPERSLEQWILDEQFELGATQGSQFAGWTDPRFLGEAQRQQANPLGFASLSQPRDH